MSNIDIYNDVCERVYAGRRNLYDLRGIDPSYGNVRVVVSELTFAAIVSEFERRTRETGFSPVYYSTPAGKIKIFGLPLEIGSDLGDDEVRFRSEVVL